MADRIVVLAALLAATVVSGWYAARGAPAPVRRHEVDVGADFGREEQARARGYHARVLPLRLAAAALPTTWLVAVGASPVGASWVRSAGGGPVGAWVVGALLLLVATALDLPFAAGVRQAQREVGLAAGDWRRWCADRAKGTLLGLGVAAGALAVLLVLRAGLPDAWWWIAAAGAGAAVLVLAFVLPVLVEPLFLRSRPLPDTPLRADLRALAHGAGVRVTEVLVVDASRRTTAFNAYVSGFGATRRVVVFDTLLAGTDEEAIRAVVAHELGHVVRRDVGTGAVVGALGAAAVVVGLGLVLDAGGVPEPAVVPAVLAYLALVGVLATPAQSALSRRIEARADAYALTLLAAERQGTPVGYARMLRALAVRGLAPLTPPPLVQVWWGTHPTIPARLAATRRWARTRPGSVEVPPLRPG